MEPQDFRPARKAAVALTDSTCTASVPAPDLLLTTELLTSAVVGSPPPLRARLLQRLLLPVGPLALAVVARGAFAKYVDYAHWSRLSMTIDDVTRITSDQVSELVRYVAQSDPTLLEQIMLMVAADPTTMSALGMSFGALLLQGRWPRSWTPAQTLG